MVKSFMDTVAEARAEVEGVKPEDVSSDALVIDVRDRADIAQTGIIPGAAAVSLGTLGYKADASMPEELQDATLVGDKDREIVVTCALGGMASLGAKTLKDLGYTNVKYMEGGTAGWKEAGLEVDDFTA